MLQPNCSEIVFWLNEKSVAKNTIFSLLDTLMLKYPLVKINSLEDFFPSTTYFLLDKDICINLLNKYPNIFNSGRRLSDEEMSDLYFNILKKINYASFWFDGQDNNLYYHQHCQQQGFPIIYEIQCLTNLQPRTYDGGSLSSYIKWKQKKGYFLTDSEIKY